MTLHEKVHKKLCEDLLMDCEEVDKVLGIVFPTIADELEKLKKDCPPRLSEGMRLSYTINEMDYGRNQAITDIQKLLRGEK